MDRNTREAGGKAKTKEQASRIQEAAPMINSAYHDGRTKDDVAREMKEATQGDGLYILGHWMDVLDGDAAAYLAHFVYYQGTQKRRDRFIFDSDEAVREKRGKTLTNRKLRRIRRDLLQLGLIEVKPGPHRVTMVRPNMTLIKAWNRYGDYDQAVLAVLKEWANGTDADPDDKRSSQQPDSDDQKSPQREQNVTTLTPKGNHSDDKKSPLITNTPNNPDTLSQSPHAKFDNAKLERCLELLGEGEISKKGLDAIAKVLPDLAARYPRPDPVYVAKLYLDKMAWMKANEREPVKFHDRYFANHYRQIHDEMEAETRSRGSSGGGFFRAADEERHERPTTELDVEAVLAEVRARTDDRETATPAQTPGETVTLEESVNGTPRQPKTVLGLLLPDGACHEHVAEALEYGNQAAGILASKVAEHLRGKREDYLDEVGKVLPQVRAAMAHTEKEVA
jgi:hypothetical protein